MALLLGLYGKPMAGNSISLLNIAESREKTRRGNQEKENSLGVGVGGMGRF